MLQNIFSYVKILIDFHVKISGRNYEYASILENLLLFPQGIERRIFKKWKARKDLSQTPCSD